MVAITCRGNSFNEIAQHISYRSSSGAKTDKYKSQQGWVMYITGVQSLGTRIHGLMYGVMYVCMYIIWTVYSQVHASRMTGANSIYPPLLTYFA